MAHQSAVSFGLGEHNANTKEVVMTMTEERSKTVVRVPARAIDMKFEIVVIPVSDVDGAWAF